MDTIKIWVKILFWLYVPYPLATPLYNGTNAVPAHHLAHQCLHGNRTQLSSRQTSMNETESNRPFGGEGRCRPHSLYLYNLTI